MVVFFASGGGLEPCTATTNRTMLLADFISLPPKLSAPSRQELYLNYGFIITEAGMNVNGILRHYEDMAVFS
jgi:hypothetical protein